MITTTIESTGEVLECEDQTPEQVLESYRLVNEYIKAYEALKKKLQAKAFSIVDENGRFEHGGYVLKVISAQRMAYDQSVLREVFDEDLLAQFTEYQKGRIDAYIAEHLDELGEQSTRLRNTMVQVGKPTTMVRLEKLTRG